MKQYQPRKNNPYQLPKNAYMRAYYLVRDYDRLQKEIEEIPYQTPYHDGQPTGNEVARPTESMAVRMAALSRQCKSVEQALFTIPQEYRRGVLASILEQAGFPDDAHPNTYSRWRCRFLWQVAKNEGII